MPNQSNSYSGYSTIGSWEELLHYEQSVRNQAAMPVVTRTRPNNSHAFWANLASFMQDNNTIADMVCYIRDVQLVDVPVELLSNRQSEICSSRSSLIISLFPEIDQYLHTCQRCNNRVRVRITVFSDATANSGAAWCGDCARNFAHYWHSDGVYRLTPQPIRNVMDYHSGDRNTLMAGVDWKDPNLMGIEIETFIPHDNAKKTAIVLEAIKDRNILPERDGSLDRNYGVEFIFAPISFFDMKDGCFIDEWSKVLRKHNCKGWNAGDGYGMHVSVNAQAMTELHIGKFCYFINNFRHLGEKVAGRTGNQYADYRTTHLKSFRRETNKYLACSRRSNTRVEVRIFKSNLNWDVIHRNCEFVHSVLQFTKLTSMKRLTPENFLIFIDKDENRKLYLGLRQLLGIAKVSSKNPAKEIVHV